jgi:hypothetical protein
MPVRARSGSVISMAPVLTGLGHFNEVEDHPAAR